MDDIDLIMKTVLKDFWDNKNDNIRNLISVLDGLIFDNKSSNTQKLISERQLYSKKKIIILDYLADEIITKSDFILQQQEYDQAINKISLEIYEIEESNKNLLSKKMRLTKIEKTLNENENVSGINEEIFNEFLDKIEVLEFNQVIVHLFEDIKYKVLLAGDNGRGNKGRTNKTIEKIELIC